MISASNPLRATKFWKAFVIKNNNFIYLFDNEKLLCWIFLWKFWSTWYYSNHEILKVGDVESGRSSLRGWKLANLFQLVSSRVSILARHFYICGGLHTGTLLTRHLLLFPSIPLRVVMVMALGNGARYKQLFHRNDLALFAKRAPP